MKYVSLQGFGHKSMQAAGYKDYRAPMTTMNTGQELCMYNPKRKENGTGEGKSISYFMCEESQNGIHVKRDRDKLVI